MRLLICLYYEAYKVPPDQQKTKTSSEIGSTKVLISAMQFRRCAVKIRFRGDSVPIPEPPAELQICSITTRHVSLTIFTYGDFFPSDNRPSCRSPRSNGVVRRGRTDSTTTWRSACVLLAGWSVSTTHTHTHIGTQYINICI